MKRAPTLVDLDTVPRAFHPLLRGARVMDSSCSPEARVLFIDREGGYYLKSAPRGTLAREAELTRYFHKKGVSAPVLEYVCAERDWLLTAAVAGEDCTHADYLANPSRLCDLLAAQLRALHALDGTDCPVQQRNRDYFETVRQNRARGVFDPTFLPKSMQGLRADEAWQILCQGEACFACNALLHGDYCLPNIMLDNWRFSGFIDLGGGGVGERHIDLFWGVWTLEFNLHTDRFGERFLDAYGRDAVDPDLLSLVALAECFG
jgi:kanamycin kinase